MSTTFNDDVLVTANVGVGTPSPGSKLDVKGTIRLSGATSGFVGLAPAAVAGSTAYTLPAADGSAGQVLTTDGAGTLSWTTPATGVSQDFRGLSLRTHPDADKAAAQVFLNHADEIAMDTGARVSNWDDLIANITSSGAGGLDTGAEAASTWYEIYAIRKSSDGTKNLLLHRAKNYLLDEQNTSTNLNYFLRDASANTKLGQTFDTDVTGPCEFVDVLLARVNSPTGRIWASIYATSTGVPTGAALKASDKLDVSVIAVSNQWIRFVFRDPQILTAGTTYALVLEGDFTISGTNNIQWPGSNASPYAAGSLYAYDGANWNNTAGSDLAFKVYVTENDANVTMPSGYDQKCKIGYVYNDGSSDLRPFVQIDRNAFNKFLVVDLGAISTSLETLMDVSAALPPGSVMARIAAYSSAADDVLEIGGVPGGYEANDLGAVRVSCGGSVTNTVSGGYAVTEFQGVYLSRSGTGNVNAVVNGYVW